MEEVLELLDPEIEVQVHTGRPDVPESGSFHGHAGFLQNAREFAEPFADFRLDVEEIIDAGDRLMGIVVARGSGRASGIPIERHIYHVWTVDDGNVTKLEIYSDRAQAEAALRPHPA